MRQRVMIAMALACDPQLLIADEPTTALDVTIQAQILDLMGKLREDSNAAIILITHDLGVIAEVCDEVLVMYAGQVVERAPVEVLFRFPQHPYTVGLLGSLPRLDAQREELAAIEGTVPDMSTRSWQVVVSRPAARFASSVCKTMPPLAAVEPEHLSRCWRAPLEKLVA
jgi:peptide/nickel transport system ATP-binding protein